MASQDAGTPAYLISNNWLKRYQKFILYDQFNMGYNENRIKILDDHFTKMHPGPVSNEEDLLEEDK